MKYQDYIESITRGTFDFPIAYYGVDRQHPRYEMMLHWHPEFELVHVRRGVLHMELDSRPLEARAGDTVLISAGVCHSASPQDADVLYECLVFDLSGFVAHTRVGSRQLTGILDHRQVIRAHLPREHTELATVLERLFDAMRDPFPGYELVVQGSFFQLLGLVTRDALYDRVAPDARRSRNQQTSLKNAVAYIREHYADRVTLDDLARAAGMNRKYFCSFFRGMTHCTPVEYLNNYRLEIACERLLASDSTIAEIAGSCGFNDVSYFTKTFHRTMGMTPRHYRKMRQN